MREYSVEITIDVTDDKEKHVGAMGCGGVIESESIDIASIIEAITRINSKMIRDEKFMDKVIVLFIENENMNKNDYINED